MTQAMTRILSRTAGLTLALVLLAGAVTGCGRYGPPQPHPPEVEEPDDEERR